MHRIYRIEHEGVPRYVVDREGAWRLLEGDLFGEFRETEQIDPSRARIRAPLHPSKIVAVGLNYKDHAAETNKPLPQEPLIFLKPSTAVIGPDEEIVLPAESNRVDHEAELGVVIGRLARRVPAAKAQDYILGYTCVNDVTARDLQNRDVQYTRSKSFDTFAPVGPCIAIGVNADAAAIECWVNDERRQASNTRELIFPVPTLVAFISNVMTLLPGDIISTGTPSGISPLKAGDRVKIKVAGVGELVNTVRAPTVA